MDNNHITGGSQSPASTIETVEFDINNGAAGRDAETRPPENPPHVACPLCGQPDGQVEQEWMQEERKRLEEYTRGQLEIIKLQRADFLKHRSEVEAALALRGQDLNRQLRQFTAQAGRLPKREQELAAREKTLAQAEATLELDRQRLATSQQELTTQQAALTLREQAAAEREAATTRREAELAAQQQRLARAEEELVKQQAAHDALHGHNQELHAEQQQLNQAIETARQQLASLEAEYARRAATHVQREEPAPRREPVAWVQEPVSPRAPAPPASPVPAPAAPTPSAEPVVPAAGSAPGLARPPVPSSGSAPGVARQLAGRTGATGTAQAAAPSEDHRTATRRRGNPVSVQITNEQRTSEAWPGWVVDRSPEGLCILADEAAEVGTVLNVRPSRAGASARWIQVLVRSCVPERSSWKLGCQFHQKLSWDDLQYFG